MKSKNKKNDITSATNNTTPTAIAEPEKKSQGGISDYSETQAKTVQRVRGEFLSDTFKPKITLAYKTITFNMACVNLFPNHQHITVSIDIHKRRLFVEPTANYDDTSLKFANFKNDRNVPRTCTTKYFCPILFDFMQWDLNAKYRILAIFQVFGDKNVIVFNLDDSLQVFSESIEIEGGKKKRNTTVIMPLDWKGRFGHTVDELAEKRRLDLSSEVITIDNKTGEKRVGNIESKPPTPEELIHQPYGGIRPRKTELKK